MTIDYSAVIRTTGHSSGLDGELDSLQRQTMPPDEIVIVIPSDVDAWTISASVVRFVHSERGMVTQRAEGIRAARHDLLLLLDDDVILEETAAERIISALATSEASCVVPTAPDLLPRGLQRALHAAFGIAVPRWRGGVTYTPSGGYIYPLKEPPAAGWPTLGGRGAVMALQRRFAVEHGTLGDYDLESLARYALRDDAALVLQQARAGGTCLLVPDVRWEHRGEPPVETSTARRQASIECHYLFWHKYIRPTSASPIRLTWAYLALGWYFVGCLVLAGGAAARNRSTSPVVGVLRGLRSVLLRRTGHRIE